MAILLENPIAAEKTLVYTHMVTMINRRTGDEKLLTIETLSDRFCDVLREVAHQRVMLGLNGYEIFECLDCNAPF